MTKMHPLTNTQREFAHENHGLVYEYLRRKGLSEDDFYDVVIFGFLKAVQIYDEQPELHQYKFRTIAFRRMYATLWNHFRDQRRPKRNAAVYSLEMTANSGTTLLERTSIPDCAAVYEHAEVREKWAEIQPKVTPRQMQALKLRAAGYTNQEIGKVYHIAPGSVSGRMTRLRRSVREAA